ncbi:MAG TPA: hypothetical protein VIF63_05030 [Candidatus Limnocylindrales bacterium]|jgi:hypothetical protein
MDFNKLSDTDKRYVLLAVGVIFGGLVGVSDGWGAFATIGLLAGIGVAGVILQPQLMPAMKLPIAKDQLVFGLAVVAAASFVLAGLGSLSAVFAITRIMSLLFDIGLVASLALAWFAWLDFKVASPEMAAKIAAAMPDKPERAGETAPAPVAAAPTPMPAAPAPEPAKEPEPEPVAAMEPETAEEMTETAAMNEPDADDDTPDASAGKPAGG